MADTNISEAEQALLDVIESIMSSEKLTPEQKDQYLEKIQSGQITPALLDELKELFTQENKQLETEISQKQQLVEELEEIQAQEQVLNDTAQAGIVAATERYVSEKAEDVKAGLEDLDKAMVDAVEEVKSEGESEEIAAIQEKLKKGE